MKTLIGILFVIVMIYVFLSSLLKGESVTLSAAAALSVPLFLFLLTFIIVGLFVVIILMLNAAWWVVLNFP